MIINKVKRVLQRFAIMKKIKISHKQFLTNKDAYLIMKEK